MRSPKRAGRGSPAAGDSRCRGPIRRARLRRCRGLTPSLRFLLLGNARRPLCVTALTAVAFRHQSTRSQSTRAATTMSFRTRGARRPTGPPWSGPLDRYACSLDDDRFRDHVGRRRARVLLPSLGDDRPPRSPADTGRLADCLEAPGPRGTSLSGTYDAQYISCDEWPLAFARRCPKARSSWTCSDPSARAGSGSTTPRSYYWTKQTLHLAGLECFAAHLWAGILARSRLARSRSWSSTWTTPTLGRRGRRRSHCVRPRRQPGGEAFRAMRPTARASASEASCWPRAPRTIGPTRSSRSEAPRMLLSLSDFAAFRGQLGREERRDPPHRRYAAALARQLRVLRRHPAERAEVKMALPEVRSSSSGGSA